MNLHYIIVDELLSTSTSTPTSLQTTTIMEGHLVYRPRVETAYPDGDFRRSDEEDDEDEEMVDDTVTHLQDTNTIDIMLMLTTGLQNNQRCRSILHRYQRVHAHETSSIRQQKSRPRLACFGRIEMCISIDAATHYFAPKRYDGSHAVRHGKIEDVRPRSRLPTVHGIPTLLRFDRA